MIVKGITQTNTGRGPIGSTGHKGTPGTQGYNMTDCKEDMTYSIFYFKLQKKYSQFTIKTKYDKMTFSPTSIIIDKSTGEEYKFKPQSMYDIMNETEQFIQKLIITIREDKINNIINGH
jgi:hypothetical protein